MQLFAIVFRLIAFNKIVWEWNCCIKERSKYRFVMGKKRKHKLLASIILRILGLPEQRRNFFFQVISPLDIVNYRYYNFTITRYNQFASRYQYPIGNDQISKVEENFSDIEEISRLIISTGREERIHFCEISFFFYKIPECQVPRIPLLAKKSCGTFIFPSRSVFLF